MTSPRSFIGATLLAVVLFGASACDASITFGQDVEAAGELVTTNFDSRDFDSITVGDSFEAFITVGDTFSVDIISNESLVGELDIRVRDRELKVGLKNGVSVRNGTLEATVVLPRLVALDVGGASSTTVRGVVEPAPQLDVSGASNLVIEGSASSVEIEASGASSVDLRIDDLADAWVDLSGASSVQLRDALRVNGEMSGASDLTLPAGAVIDIESSGASSIIGR